LVKLQQFQLPPFAHDSVVVVVVVVVVEQLIVYSIFFCSK
jgi:hypothetical protein